MATRYAELVERLNGKADRWAQQCEEWIKRITEANPGVDLSKEIAMMRESTDREAAAAITALEARCERLAEALRQLLRCEYDGPGLRDCTDNYGVPYQSAALAARIADGERLLASVESKP